VEKRREAGRRNVAGCWLLVEKKVKGETPGLKPIQNDASRDTNDEILVTSDEQLATIHEIPATDKDEG